MAKLTTLGGLALHPGPFTQPKPLAMLAYLALEGRKPRRHLAEFLWPEGNGLKSLSMAITRLRKADPLACAADAKLVWTELECDATRLLAALEADDLTAASALYGGAFLEGATFQGASAELEEWVLETRERLAEGYRALLLRRAEAELAAGKPEHAAERAALAYRLAGAAPASPESLQRLHRLLALSHHELAGTVSAELEELGADPNPDQGTPLAQRTRGLFSTPFVGREAELAAIASALGRQETRVLTLLGPAGSGKTRLAARAALEAEAHGPFAGAVHLALLDDLDQPQLLPSRLGQVLGFQAPPSEDPWRQLAAAIGDRKLLLVLDNVEQLRGAADDLGHLVAGAPGLTLLLTSREALGLPGEQALAVGGLPAPEPGTAWDEALRYPAVRLLTDLALALKANLDLRSQAAGVLRVCRELGGLPLGLELASAWLRILPAAALAERIASDPASLGDLAAGAGRGDGDGPAGLQAVVEATWTVLSAEEQAALARLAVFTGGFDYQAAEAVAGVDVGTLAALLDKAWLRSPAPGRFDRHQHVYAFTRAKLAPLAGEVAGLRERHARWFAELARRSDERLRGPEQLEHLRLLDAEHANLRQALAYFAETDPASGLALAADLGTFWSLRGHDAEGLGYLQAFIGGEGAALPARVLVKAQVSAAQLAERLGRDSLAGSLYERALEGAEALRDRCLSAEANLGLAVCVRQNHGDYPGALRHMEVALGQARAGGSPLLASDALRVTGDLLANTGEYERAVSYLEEAATLASDGGDELSEAKAELSLSGVLVYMREDGRGRWLAERSLATFRKLGDRLGEASALANLGTLIDERGDAHECKRLYRQSLAILRQLGDPRATATLLNNLASVCNTLGEYEEAQAHLEESLNWLRRASDAALTTHALYLYGIVLLKVGDMAACRRRLDECIELCRRHGETWSLMRALTVLARWHRAVDDLAAAIACAREAEELAEAAGDERTGARAKALLEELRVASAACGAPVAAGS
ncbi:MAG: tetratricopeptide repeat protein [Trueperaceae bacterium]|nr:tetratricopeptide repeat protein [Trueperaceae bacterium]